MRIAFDHQAFCLQKTGGISRYFCRLAQELDELEQQVGIFAPLYRNQYLKSVRKPLVHGFVVNNYPPKTAGAFVRGNAWLSSPLMRRWHPDIIHETYFSALPTGLTHLDVKSKSFTPRVVTVFDMISEIELSTSKDADTDMRHLAKYAAVKRADHVVCISEHTRKDLLKFFGVSAEKTSVIHLGCDVPKMRAQDTLQTLHSRPYLLYVGLRSGYKNFAMLLQAIASSIEIKRDFDLIAFGGNTFTAEESQLIAQLGFHSGQVRQIVGSDLELNKLYAHAAGFVYPSTYEGFGLPPLEAMAHNCPVISSNTSSMPEVIGEAAQYFDPTSIESMRSAIAAVLYNPVRANELREMGQKRIQGFTWQQCAQKTLRLYQSLTTSSVTD